MDSPIYGYKTRLSTGFIGIFWTLQPFTMLMFNSELSNIAYKSPGLLKKSVNFQLLVNEQI